MSIDEKYRPKLHLTATKGWLNDPNGLIFYNGEFHQFYQYHPHSAQWGPMHWGHQTSKDLINWTEQKIALAPDNQGMCFSGSAVYDKDNSSGLFEESGGLVALYTSFTEIDNACIHGQKDSQPEQHQSLAYSQDGISWTKYQQGKPVLRSLGNPDFRDPKVFWHPETESWVMVLACGQHIELFRSHNLVDWKKTSEFGHRFGFHSTGPWECPDLFPLTCQSTGHCYWVLIVGIGDGVWTGGSGTQYFIGTFDGFKFESLYPHRDIKWLDYGRDHYATQSFSNMPDEIRLVSAWASNHQYAKNTPTEFFRGALLFPRRLYIDTSETHTPLLKQSFADSLIDAFNASEQHSFSLKNEESMTQTLTATTALVELSFCLQNSQGLTISFFDCCELTYTFLLEENTLRVITIRQNALSEPLKENGFNHVYDVSFDAVEKINLQFLIDKGVTAMLINQQYAFTNLAFPINTNIEVLLKCLNGPLDLKASYFI